MPPQGSARMTLLDRKEKARKILDRALRKIHKLDLILVERKPFDEHSLTSNNLHFRGKGEKP